MSERAKQKEINYHLNKIILPDGTMFYCNDKFLKDLEEEIFKTIREENIKSYFIKL